MKPSKTPRTIVYARISSNKPGAIEQQLDLCRRYFSTRRKCASSRIHRVHEKTSGADAKSLKRFVATLKSGDVLITADLTRLGRNEIKVTKLLKRLQEKGVKVVVGTRS